MVQGLEWSADFSLLAVWDSMKRILFLNLNGEPAQTVHYCDSSVTKFIATSFAPGNDLFVASICAEQVLNLILKLILSFWVYAKFLKLSHTTTFEGQQNYCVQPLDLELKCYS